MRETGVSHGDDGFALVVSDVPWLPAAVATALAGLCACSGHRLCGTRYGGRILSTALDTKRFERVRLPLTTVEARSLEPSFVDMILWWRLMDETDPD